MNSELARDRVTKLLLEVAIDLGLNLIVKTSILLEWICFTLRIASSNTPLGFFLKMVRFIGFPKSSYHYIIYFSAVLHDMIYYYLTYI